MAQIGAVQITGPDAASFLHSQTTNDVVALAAGQGHANARVERTGHVVSSFSLHALPTDGYLALLERSGVDALIDALDRFLFADKVEIADVSDDYTWLTLQGPRAPDVAQGVFGTLSFEAWQSLPEYAVRQLRRARKEHSLAVPEGTLAIRRSLSGDIGYIFAIPGDAPGFSDVIAVVSEQQDVVVVEGTDLSEALETLRMEAGIVRIAADAAGRPRLLPETGLEQRAVSYTKGCYLGQEVIARIRTYGSIPRALRVLIFEAAELDQLPPPGSKLTIGDDTKAGEIASRTYSPLVSAPIAFAYLSRNHRTPGNIIEIASGAIRLRARVALPPLYSAPDLAARVQYLYDRAIRTFAGGDQVGATVFLEEALSLDPGFADGYETIGVILGRTGRFHEAIDFFRRLEEVAPDEPMVNTNLSLYYMKIGDRTTAEAEAAKATTKGFSKLASGRKGDTKSAAEVAKEQLQARLQDAQRKKDMFSKVLAFDPLDPIALFGIGNAMSLLGEHQKAVDALDKAVEVDKNNSAVYLAKGKALEAMDRPAEALEVYTAGMDVASRRGDLMPLKEMEHRVLLLKATATMNLDGDSAP